MSTAAAISILFAIALCGFFVWLVKFAPIDATYQTILKGVFFTIWWILSRLNVPGIPHLG